MNKETRKVIAKDAMNLLAAAWNEFSKLSWPAWDTSYNRDNVHDFRKVIHDGQRILATMVLKDENPEFFDGRRDIDYPRFDKLEIPDWMLKSKEDIKKDLGIIDEPNEGPIGPLEPKFPEDRVEPGQSSEDISK